MAVDKLSIEVEANTSGIDKLNESLKKLNRNLNKTNDSGDKADSGFKKITRAVNGFARAIERIDITPIERLANALEKIAAVKFTGTGKQIEKVAKAGEALAVTEPQIGGTVQTSGASVPTPPVEKMNAFAKAAQLGRTAVQGLGKGLGFLGKAASKALSPLGYLISIFGRMILFNLVFRFLMLISDAVNVGITNLYNYSKAWNNIDWMKTQQSMDDLAATAQQLKNTFGVTLMSVLAAAKPILDTIAQAFINAANAINAFLAALKGSSTFTKATKQAKAWGEATSSAAKAAKNATAGIDELNIISKDSGGGGGASTPDYSNMFEEVEVPSKIKDTLQWIQDHLKEILALALAIGAALLAWKILSALPSGLLTLAQKFGILLAVVGAVLLAFGAIDAWVNGVTWTNLAMMIGGTVAMALGLYMVLGAIGAAIGLLVGGIVMIVVALHDWITAGELTTQSMTLLLTGITAVSVALALLTSSPIPLLIGAIAGLAVLIAKFVQEDEVLSAKVKEQWDRVVNAFKELGTACKPAVDALKNAVIAFGEAMLPVINGIIDVIATLVTWLVSSLAEALPYVIGAIADAIEFITNIINAFTSLFKGDFEGFKKYLFAAVVNVVDFINNIIDIGLAFLKTLLKNFVTYFKDKFNTFKAFVVLAVTTWFTNLRNKLESFIAIAKAKIYEFIMNCIRKFTDFKRDVSNVFTNLKTSVTTIFNNIKTTITTTVTNLVTNVTNKFTEFKDGIISIFDGMWVGIKNVINTILGGIEKMVNGVIGGLNKMINALNSLSFDVPDWVPEIGGGTFGFNISNLQEITIPQLANGGMVEAGQLFIANEAGAELVGSMGGNTTVANNEQIISGIQHGVEIAVSQILAPYLSDIAENTRETANKDFSVNIGDREIARANIRGQRSLGRSIISTV